MYYLTTLLDVRLVHFFLEQFKSKNMCRIMVGLSTRNFFHLALKNILFKFENWRSISKWKLTKNFYQFTTQIYQEIGKSILTVNKKW